MFRTEDELCAAVAEVLDKHDVKGLLDISLEKQKTRKNCYVGRGRGSDTRPTIEKVETRFCIADVKCLPAEITKLRVRSSLMTKGETLVGLKLGAPKQETATPTATSFRGLRFTVSPWYKDT